MRRRHPTATERAECVRLYSGGALLKHLVEQFGRPRPTIGRWIKGAGVKRGHKFRGRPLIISREAGRDRLACVEVKVGVGLGATLFNSTRQGHEQ